MNSESKAFLVINAHRSEYPNPITFRKGTPLVVGERYEGEEEWHDWFFCHCDGQQGGWVPAQIIGSAGDGTARALEDYTARELSVQAGDRLSGHRMINGWIWCVREQEGASGWVPLANLREA
ncbi:SH3 domain-containing protein [Aeromonas bivalvium]|uniref:SH3 domain-containing protein n=1 Tax=Aeromonas bivalvium TaxID=440079 RepID=UPI00370A8561